jgi:hypothetical protein
MTVPRSARRLIAAAIVLAVIDLFVPAIRHRLEAARYETTSSPARFENSDFFALGPLVQYLREHPRGTRPRTVFLGNSVLFGYGLEPRDAVPAVYQRLSSGEKVFNASVNGLDLMSAFLIVKSMADAVDTVFVLSREGTSANTMLPRLIPVAAADAQRFKVRLPTASPLMPIAERWNLYRDSYRIQAALFGTSTRQFVYLHKGELARRLLGSIDGRQDGFAPAERSAALPAVTAAIPLAPAPAGANAALAQSHPLIVDLAELFRSRGKRLVLVQVRGYSEYLAEPAVAAFNTVYSPHAQIAIVDVPAGARFDDSHFTRDGAAALARELRRVVPERQ